MGDGAEWITPSDKRWDPNQKSVSDWVEPDNIAECQTRWLVDLFKPIKDKCIGLLYGNHEESIRIHNHNNVQKNLCERLAVDNLGYSAFVRLFFRRESSNETHIIKGAFTHGASSAITKGAKLNKLRQFMNDFDAHIYGYAHMHDIIIDDKSYMSLTPRAFGQSDIKSSESVGVVTGCWFRTYTKGIHASYGERKAYPPTAIGCPVITIDASTQSIEAHKSR